MSQHDYAAEPFRRPNATARRLLIEALEHKGHAKPTPLALRLLGLYALGESDADAHAVTRAVTQLPLTRFDRFDLTGRPAPRPTVKVQEIRHQLVDGRYAETGRVVRFIPFTKWLRDHDLDAVVEHLGNEPLAPKERETLLKLASGVPS